MRTYLIYIIINKLWIKLLRLLSIVISMNSNNIVNKSASYTQEYPHVVNCLITLSTVLTCTLIISKNFPNIKSIQTTNIFQEYFALIKFEFYMISTPPRNTQ